MTSSETILSYSLYNLKHFLTLHHVHAAEHHDDLVEKGVADALVHVQRVGIAAYLCLSLLHGCLHLGLRGLALEVLQFDDVGMLHVGEDLVAGTEEDIGIATLVVQFRDPAVAAALACPGQCVAMHEGLTLLAVTL